MRITSAYQLQPVHIAAVKTAILRQKLDYSACETIASMICDHIGIGNA